MMCKNPYVRNEHVTKNSKLHTDSAKMAAMPFGCGRCLPCRINKAREWTHRMVLESNCHVHKSFVTLTYDDENYPEDGSVSKAELQQYLKRLRSNLDNRRIRYVAVGEYGKETGRAHYHLALFGADRNHEDAIIKSWTKCDPEIGITIDELSHDSARYISGYCVKKLTRDGDKRLNGRNPEFMLTSKQDGGIGYPQVRLIAEEIKKQEYFDKEKIGIIREWKIGNKKYPLGRYLTQKLIEELGITEERRKLEILKYQAELMETNNNEDNYYYNLINNGRQKRVKQEKKQKIWKQRRSI